MDNIQNALEWGELEASCKSCEKCELHRTRTNSVFGKGSRTAQILFIGEAPGEEEDKTGLPFVGRAGKLLDKLFYAVDLTLDNIYVANILKCRPPNNRDPKDDESQVCLPFLRGQTKLLDPKIIVCLGRISAMKIIKPDFKITSEHGKWFLKNGVYLCAVYHPSALLRDPAKKGDTLIDFKNIRSKAEELGILT